jgi:hypothetical protein
MFRQANRAPASGAALSASSQAETGILIWWLGALLFRTPEVAAIYEKALAFFLLLLLGGTLLYAVITRIIVPIRKPPKN